MYYYRLPLNYLLNKLTDDIITDDQTVIILEKYRLLYNNTDMYNMFVCKEGMPLIWSLIKNEKEQSVKYLLDNGVHWWLDDNYKWGSLYDLNPKDFIKYAENDPAHKKCHMLIYDAICEYIFNKSLRGTWINACIF